MIAAPRSGAGKTTVTLALLRALRNNGVNVASAKAGPDYIDPKFHEAASGRPCVNLDPWAMTPDMLQGLAGAQMYDADMLLVEGAMGLFDGALDGSGSAADLAATLSLPVVLVVDCVRQAQSVAALVSGFRDFRTDVRLAGLILNRVSSARHEAMLRSSLAPLGLPILGILPTIGGLELPARHLGLVQAGEHEDLEAYLQEAARICTRHIDLAALASLSAPLTEATVPVGLPPFGQHIAVASDIAFAFAYPHLLQGWWRAGAALSFFSPLANEAPDPEADAIFLPGGYPELYAGQLAENANFRAGMMAAAARDVLIYGECGGYMVLGEGMTDADGNMHEMLGLLPLETSFAERRLHLGYRRLTPVTDLPWSVPLAGHEFHYASIVRESSADCLFHARDAENKDLADMGLRNGTVMGSFAHVIAATDA